jgi:cytochrome P450
VSSTDLDSFDPFRDGWSEISYATMAALRRHRPVARTPSGFWYLSRYDDCRRALGDNKAFSNVGGLRAAGVVIPREQRMINEMDPPDHTRLRKLEQSVLHSASFRALEPYIRKLCGELVGGLPAGEAVDLLPRITRPIPSQVAAHLIGVPPADYEQFSRWSHEVCTSTWITHNRTERGEGLEGSHPEFAGYIDALVAQRRAAAHPSDDLLTRLLQARGEDAAPLTPTELRIAMAHLIIAGNDTTTHLLGNLLHRLCESPALYGRLRGDRSLIRAAIEESLRFDAVIQLLTRQAAREVEIGGERLPAGARVVVGMASANRDEAAFGPDADQFRVDRTDPPLQLTFGYGPHLCLGANLARLEAEVLADTVLDRFARAELAPGYRFQRVPAFWELGPARLDVRLYD